MRIATWNVNSLRQRTEHVRNWLEENPVDVLCLQETKCQNQDFPLEELCGLDYYITFSGQKTYNGVAMLTRQPAEDILITIPGVDDSERRILGATIGGVRLLNLYVVNGKEVGDPKYVYKLDWLARLREFLEGDAAQHEYYVIVGDFNIAPEDEDLPDGWSVELLCSEPERERYREICALGFEDCFRRFEQAPDSFSWWDYRGGNFLRNFGVRIDLILASAKAAEKCHACFIDRAPRTWEKPSDHAPVVADFAFA